MPIVMYVGSDRIEILQSSEDRIQELGESAVLAGNAMPGDNGRLITYVYNRVGKGIMFTRPGTPIDIYRE